ncbi:hypothetical protein CIPAW_12G098700 [Carya illinoinensis]|uniref:Uncharacterized protein n=1 Tax=Carya illinoinensis TaxID=32201 RepID=A0A8T1NWZ6_CARIL|nr:hypothetical protein CIPAW_12G098700 [Carya illinoinensis]
MSFASVELGVGNSHSESAKLRHADLPLSAKAATSCARAAISGVGYVPSHILEVLLGSRTSQTHLFLFLLLTPRYTGCRVSLNILLPARFLGVLEASTLTSSSE